MLNFEYSDWSSESKAQDTNEARVVLFISRNKDNNKLANFHERRRAFLTRKKIGDLIPKFESFVNEGINGENCRFYISVNARDIAKTKKALIHKLIDSETDTELFHPEAYIAGIAAKHENALTKKWLFDLDSINSAIFDKVVYYIKQSGASIENVINTPNGVHIITDHGFDCRKLLEEVPEVTLKRDDLYLVTWRIKY